MCSLLFIIMKENCNGSIANEVTLGPSILSLPFPTSTCEVLLMELE